MKTLRIIVASACSLTSMVAADQETIRDVVKRQQGRVEFYVSREFSPVELSELVGGADLIARVLVLDTVSSRLSSDERAIVSEFSVKILDQFFSQRQLAPAANIIVTKPGGNMTLDGYQVTSLERDFPSFSLGEEYILFLRFDPTTGHYVVPFGAQGAFSNVSGTVEQVSRDTGKWNRDKGPMPILKFMQELSEALKSR